MANSIDPDQTAPLAELELLRDFALPSNPLSYFRKCTSCSVGFLPNPRRIFPSFLTAKLPRSLPPSSLQACGKSVDRVLWCCMGTSHAFLPLFQRETFFVTYSLLP